MGFRDPNTLNCQRRYRIQSAVAHGVLIVAGLLVLFSARLRPDHRWLMFLAGAIIMLLHAWLLF